MKPLLSVVTALPSASPQSSGAFTIYIMGSLVDGAFPVHSLGCDDNMEVGNYDACQLN